MKILAFLQNQWVRNPDHVRRVYAARPRDGFELTARFLFAGCLTGRRLEECLGSELCSKILWANSTPEIFSKASFAPKADLDHMMETLRSCKPDLVILFGRTSCKGYEKLKARSYVLLPMELTAPHPASREGGVRGSLRILRCEIEYRIRKEE